MNTGAGIALIAGMLSAPVAASAHDGSNAVETALAGCLASSSSQIPKATPASELPPGLSRKDVHVEPIAGAAGKAYRYEGTSPAEISCGIALYGPVPRSLESRLVMLVDGHKDRWTRHAPGPYRLAPGFPARQSYWGAPLGPGVSGVLLLARAPSAKAPTFEIDVHTVLMR
ncbi:MAG: hypothetical protein JWM65_473 [Sphingomonas bacterium]|nr:hypothetical protein [Sphingomonas bacterium]